MSLWETAHRTTKVVASPPPCLCAIGHPPLPFWFCAIGHPPLPFWFCAIGYPCFPAVALSDEAPFDRGIQRRDRFARTAGARQLTTVRRGRSVIGSAAVASSKALARTDQAKPRAAMAGSTMRAPRK